MWISTLLPQTFQLFVFRYTRAFLERPYISPSPLSCKRYTADTVKNGDRNGGTFTRIQIEPFCWRARASLAAPTAASPSQSAEKPAWTHGYKGVVAFCGNNQQVVAKQGYECISSAVNTVACRVHRLSFCFGPSLKGCRFCARVRPWSKETKGDWGSGKTKDEERRTSRRYIYDRCRPMAKSFSLIVSRTLLFVHSALH